MTNKVTEAQTLATRLSEYKSNPHHINPMSGRFYALIDDVLAYLRSAALSLKEADAVVNPLAIEALTNNQRQLDQDGVEVGVSRQALDEVLAALTALAAPVATQAEAKAAGIRQAAETVDKVDECKFPYCECSMGAAERCSKGRKGP